jgi:hypothetical protein
MPEIANPEELMTALGAVVEAPDPIDALKARGFTFAPALARLIDSPAAHARLRSPERQRLLSTGRRRRAPALQIGPLTRTLALLPGNHHDLTVGLKLEKVNEVLAGVYATRSIPRDVSLGTGSTAGSLDTLLSVLRNELVGVPPGADIRIGTLHITAPPTVTALPTPTRPNTPIDPTARLQIHLPVTLDFDRRPASGPFQPAVATMKAVAHFGIAVSARIEETTLRVTAGPIPGIVAAADPERLRLTIAADSPLPPKDAGSGDRIGLAVELGGFQKILTDIAVATSLAPRVKLPIGAGFDVLVRHVDLRAVPSSGAGHLMVGLEIGAEPTPVPLTGQPELLERNPFDDSGSTLYVEAHAELLKVLVRQAFKSGELQRLAKARVDNVKLTGADAELSANSIGVFLEGTLVDECGLFGSNFKDVDFDGWTRVESRGIQNGEIVFETVESLGVGDADASDIVICVLLSFLDLKILSIGKALLEAFFSKLSGWIFGSSSPTSQFVAVFEPNVSIPLTELLPRVRALGVSIDVAAIRVQASFDLVRDDINTYVYLRCVTEGLPQIGGGLPAKGVGARLLDQDVPAPPGDDAPVPTEGTTETPVGPRRMRTVTVSFNPNSADQEMARGTTDGQGRLQLVISPGRLQSRAGVLTTTTILEDIQTGETISSNTQTRVISERRPDLYFLLQVQNQRVVDSRSQPGGFIVNINTKRWGTIEQPLVFRVPRPGLVIEQ